MKITRMRSSFVLLASSLILSGCGEGETATTLAKEVPSSSDTSTAANEIRGTKNLLWVVLDTTRADHLSTYGYPKKTTPAIDKLARRGVRFDAAFAQASITAVSAASYLTGTYPFRNGIRSLFSVGQDEMPEDLPTLAERLWETGRNTASFVSAGPMSKRYGFSAGFDLYDDIFSADQKALEEAARDPNKKPDLKAQRRADETTDLAVEWLDQNGKDPFFLFVHFFDVHDGVIKPPQEFLDKWDERYPLKVDLEPRRREERGESAREANPEEDALRKRLHELRSKEGEPSSRERAARRERPARGERDPNLSQEDRRKLVQDRRAQREEVREVREALAALDTDGPSDSSREQKIQLYDAELYFMDQQVERMLAKLEEMGTAKDTMIVIVADHGEGLGDHGFWSHGTLHEEQIRVPLILAGPGIEPYGAVSDPVRLVDVSATVEEMFQLEPLYRELDGVSLMPLIRGEPEADLRTVYAEVHFPPQNPNRLDSEMYSIRVGRWKYIHRQEDTHELYDLEADPGELTNLYAEQPKIAARLLEQIHRMDAIDGRVYETEDLDPEAKAMLEATGYIDADN